MIYLEVSRLAWSFMHEDENILCLFIERKLSVIHLSALCNKRIGPDDKILDRAKEFQQKANLSSKDAIHIACADYFGCRYFITCDEVLLKRSKRLNLNIEIMKNVSGHRNKTVTIFSSAVNFFLFFPDISYPPY